MWLLRYHNGYESVCRTVYPGSIPGRYLASDAVRHFLHFVILLSQQCFLLTFLGLNLNF